MQWPCQSQEVQVLERIGEVKAYYPWNVKSINRRLTKIVYLFVPSGTKSKFNILRSAMHSHSIAVLDIKLLPNDGSVGVSLSKRYV